MKAFPIVWFAALLGVAGARVEAPSSAAEIEGQVPTLKLPWGVYQAKMLEGDPNVINHPFSPGYMMCSDDMADTHFREYPIWCETGALQRTRVPLPTQILCSAKHGWSELHSDRHHRVGAYGWLAGDYMQEVAQPNAGLCDQALLFKWIQMYIDKVGGDRDQVSVFGESAGAGSILHHLIREGGTKDPGFGAFAVQSPAYEWAWDNTPGGTLDQIYQNFSQLAGYGLSFDIRCLRSSDNHSDANQMLVDTVKPTGLFPFGPAVDGQWARTIPTISPLEGMSAFLQRGLVLTCHRKPLAEY